MSVDSASFKNRYQSSKYVDFWMADKGMEAGRRFWRRRLLSFLPFDPSQAINVLDLGAGTGALSLELLNRYPDIRLTCLDFSEAMLFHAQKQLAKFEAKVVFVQSSLRNAGWSKNVKGTFDAVVCSFLTHTIPNNIKPLYQELFGIVNRGGCFLSCDIFAPPGSTLQAIYQQTRLIEFQERIKGKTGVEKSLKEIDQLLCERRNSYKAFFEDSDAVLSLGSPTMLNHLEWLREAGFDEVDCLFKHARNAVIGGFRHNP